MSRPPVVVLLLLAVGAPGCSNEGEPPSEREGAPSGAHRALVALSERIIPGRPSPFGAKYTLRAETVSLAADGVLVLGTKGEGRGVEMIALKDGEPWKTAAREIRITVREGDSPDMHRFEVRMMDIKRTSPDGSRTTTADEVTLLVEIPKVP